MVSRMEKTRSGKRKRWSGERRQEDRKGNKIGIGYTETEV